MFVSPAFSTPTRPMTSPQPSPFTPHTNFNKVSLSASSAQQQRQGLQTTDRVFHLMLHIMEAISTITTLSRSNINEWLIRDRSLNPNMYRRFNTLATILDTTKHKNLTLEIDVENPPEKKLTLFISPNGPRNTYNWGVDINSLSIHGSIGEIQRFIADTPKLKKLLRLTEAVYTLRIKPNDPNNMPDFLRVRRPAKRYPFKVDENGLSINGTKRTIQAIFADEKALARLFQFMDQCDKKIATSLEKNSTPKK